MFPSGSLVEVYYNNAHPAHGIQLWRLENQICHQFLNPLSCDTLPFRRLLRHQSLTSLDPAISDAYQRPTHTKEMDGC